MSSRPNLLFLTHRVPHPPNRGDRIRSWNVLRFLAERADVHLACLTEEPVAVESRAELNRLCRRVAIQELSTTGRWVHGCSAWLTGRSATEGLFHSRGLTATVRAWANETRFDSVLAFCSSTFQFADVRELDGVPLVVDLVDVDSEKWLNYSETAAFWKRLLYRWEANRVRRLEQAIAKRANAVTLVSEEEVAVFRRFCDADNVHAVSNGVDLDYFHPATNQSVGQDVTQDQNQRAFTLVFVGVLDYRANLEGLRWFCRDIWPSLRQTIPGIELRLVGRRPGEAVRQLAQQHPGVTLVGEVPDVRPEVWNADVVIAPLTIARGIQNKVLEALAMAKPVVATPQAIAGTGTIPGIHLLAAAAPEEWVKTLGDLRANPAIGHSLARAARGYVEKTLNWTARLGKFGTLLKLPEPSKANIAAPHTRRFRKAKLTP